MADKLKTAVFEQRIYKLVAAIPKGKVTSYGHLAIMAGRPNGARSAGRALHFAPPGLPCHRVVNSAGRTAPGWAEQKALLQAEGVTFRPSGCVNMALHRWDAVVHSGE